MDANGQPDEVITDRSAALGHGLCCVDGLHATGVGPAVKRRRRPVPPFDISAFAGFRFPPEVIVLAVRCYLRFGLSYRDLEDPLSAASKSIRSPCFVGCNGSRRCASTRPDHAAMSSGLDGS